MKPGSGGTPEARTAAKLTSMRVHTVASAEKTPLNISTAQTRH